MQTTTQTQDEYIAQLQKYSEDLRKHAELLEQRLDKQSLTSATSRFDKLKEQAPMLLLVVVVGALLYFRPANQNGPNVPDNNEKTPKQVVAEYFPGVKSSYKATFKVAAEKVADKSIKTDKELFNFVKPALEQLRVEKQKSFDSMFDVSLPRNSDGSFEGEKDFVKDASKFLLLISENW